MNPPPTIRGIIPSAEITGDSSEETSLLLADLGEAERFLLSKRWCFGLGDIYFGAGLGGVVSVFFAEIKPTASFVDRWLWVVVGDVPPVYLVIDVLPDPISALNEYIVLMQQWVDLARLGESSQDVIPVNVAPTAENAERLQGRLTTLKEHIVPWLVQSQVPS